MSERPVLIETVAEGRGEYPMKARCMTDRRYRALGSGRAEFSRRSRASQLESTRARYRG
jgi:hypothetical protein